MSHIHTFFISIETGSLLGKAIQNGLKGALDPAFTSINEIAKGMHINTTVPLFGKLSP